MAKDATHLGTVENVQGATVSVEMDPATVSGLAFVDGHAYRIGQVGSFVRIPLGYVDLFGIVSQAGAAAVPQSVIAEYGGRRWLTVQIVGEGQRRGQFRRGISQYPTIGDEVYLVTEPDLARIYGRPESPKLIRVGHLASAETIPALLDIDRLLTRHSAVLGTTGAGKSTTVAGLINALSDAVTYPSARIMILDIHGEYASALRDKATVFRLNPDTAKGERPLFVPFWAMTFDELLTVATGSLDDTGRGGVLEKITDQKLASLRLQARPGVSEDNLTVDTPVPFSLHRTWFDLHRLVNATHTAPPGAGQSDETEALLEDEQGNMVERGEPMRVIPPRYKSQTSGGPDRVYLSGSALNIKRPLETLASRLRDPRFGFLFSPGRWLPDENGIPESDLDELLEEWIGGPQPVTILDLSGVPISVLTDLIGVLLRVIYDALFWSRDLAEGGRERPMLVVLEEAHAYLGPDSGGEAAAAVRRIVKEGRKYGVGAMIVSQRPAEIDATVLSQCGTLIAMRLANSTDRAHVTGAASDNLEGLFSMLPVLRTGEAIIVGEAVHLPVRAMVDPPPADRRPDSTDPLVYNEFGPGGWNSERRSASDYKEVMTVWRSQQPKSPRIVPEDRDDA